jgi:hypothetical protein
MSASPAAGAAPQTEQVTAAVPGLAAGTYIGQVSIAAAGAQDSPATVPVTFVVSAPVSQPGLTVTPSSLASSYILYIRWANTRPASPTVSKSGTLRLAASSMSTIAHKNTMTNGSGMGVSKRHGSNDRTYPSAPRVSRIAPVTNGLPRQSMPAVSCTRKRLPSPALFTSIGSFHQRDKKTGTASVGREPKLSSPRFTDVCRFGGTVEPGTILHAPGVATQ